MKPRNITVAMAFSALIALPACSNLLGHGSSASNSGATRTAAATTSPAVSNDMVRQVQSRLQHDGYYKTGSVDGIWGSGTESAVMAFQRDHNLSASGQLDAPTLQAMNVIGTNAANNDVNAPNYNANAANTAGTPNYNANRSDVTPPPANWDTRPPGTPAPNNTGR